MRPLLRAALGVLAGAAVLPLLTAAPAAAAAEGSAVAEGMRVTVTSIAPAAVEPGTPLVVRGQVTADVPVTNARASLSLESGLLDTREALREWTARGAAPGVTRELPGAVTLPPLAEGRPVPFQITVPAGGLELSRQFSAFGPRGLTVQVEGVGGSASLRTTIVWFPGKEFNPTRISLLAPVTAGRSEDAAAPSAETAAELAPDGRLGRLLEATGDPGVAWALDPAAFSAAARLADGGGSPEPTPSATDDPGTGPTPTEGPDEQTVDPQDAQAGAGWLARLQGGRRDRDVIALPFADPDTAALARAGAGDLLGTADALGRQAAEDVTGGQLDRSVAWPSDGYADPATLDAGATAGRTAVVLAAGSQPLADPEDSSTPTGRSRIQTAAGRVDGLLYDEQLSALFAQTGGAEAAVASQSLLAELAAITLELPGRTRHVLAAAPRDWNPSPAGVRAATAALRSVPWVQVRPLSELRATEPPGERTGPDYPAGSASSELPGEHVEAAVDLRAETVKFGKALADPAPVVDPLLERDVSLVSSAWRGATGELPAARAPLAREVNDLSRGVHIVLGTERPFFLASEARLPVYVANGTPYPVRVQVVLKPRSGRLVIDEPVPVDLDPNTARAQVLVPVRALASGDTQIGASVRAPDGTLLGSERTLTIRVRREWEQRGLIGAGAVLGLLLVVGLLRGVRRGDREQVRPEDVPDVDDLASATGDRAAARMDAIHKTGSIPIVRTDNTSEEESSTRDDDVDGTSPENRTSRENQADQGPVASPDGGVHDARDKPVMSREQQ